jgi:hypothetical protein
MAPLARAFAELPQAAERKQLGMQNRNPESDACDIDARLAQAQGEGFDKFGRIGELAGVSQEPADDGMALPGCDRLRFSP